MVKTRGTFPKFGEIVVRKKLASPQTINEALALQRLEVEEDRPPLKLGELLVQQNILDPKTVRDILDEQKLGVSSRRVLKVRTAVKQGIVIVSLEGRLDLVKGEILKKTLVRLMDEGMAKFAINADRLVYVNIAGLSVILNLVDHARSLGGDVKFYSVTYTGMIFRRIGLDRFIQILEGERAAIDAFRESIDEVMSRGTVGEYVSTQNSKYFHLSYCKTTLETPLTEKLFYPNKTHARDDGKVPCPACKP